MAVPAKAVPIDVIVMVERSLVMNEEVGTSGITRWELARRGIQQFLGVPKAEVVGIGLQFFSAEGSDEETVECVPAVYASLAVEVGLAPDVAPDITQAFEAVVPAGAAPTAAALEGALAAASSAVATRPERESAVVLVTGGPPTQCEPQDLAILAQLAHGAWSGATAIGTYVISMDASVDYDRVAAAGGTRTAYAVDDADNPVRSVTDALLDATDEEGRCQFELPTGPGGEPADPGRVRLVSEPAAQALEEIPRAADVASCGDAGGWYYDDPEDPRKIHLCPCTCKRLRPGELRIEMGCRPFVVSHG